MGMTVEEYVLSMQFDNREFEKNVDKTTKSLGTLKDSLKMDGASRGLNDLSKSMKDMEYASYKTGFQWSDVMGKLSSTIEWRIARKAVDSVTQGLTNLVGMLTGMSHIKSGLGEYETQLNAIQTILANTKSKGTTLDDVNSALDELNKYADKTIYNFTEMTKNIGTFTAAGVDLDTSVNAIQGIANLAAVSGSTSQQASTAMYQLSQALASGTVKLMDWNSVVNAGMGGEVFQNALKETARLHGVAVDQIIKDQGSFRNSLSEGWLTTDILTETLKKFTYSAKEGTDEWKALMESLKAEGYSETQAREIIELGNTATDAATKVKTFTQLMDTLKESVGSGWAQSWEIIIGDFEQAKSMWSSLSDFFSGIINKSSDVRNSMLSNVFSDGWSQLTSKGSIQNQYGLIGWISTVAKGAKDGGDAFSKLVEEYGSIEKAIPHALEKGILTSDDMAEAINGHYLQVKDLSDAQKEALGYTPELLKQFEEFNKTIQDNKNLLKEDGKTLTFFGEIMDSLSREMSGRDLLIGPQGAIANLYKFIMSIIEPIKKAFREIFGDKSTYEYAERIFNIIKRFQEFTASLKLIEDDVNDNNDTFSKIQRTFKGLFAAIDIVLTVLKAIGKVIGYVFQAFGPVTDVILSITAALGDFFVWLKKVIDSSEPFKMVADGLGEALLWVSNGIKSLVDQSRELDFTFLKEAFQQVKVVLVALWASIKMIFGQFWSTLYDKAQSGEKITLQEVLEGLLQVVKGVLSGVVIGKLISLIKSLKQPKDQFMGFVREFKEELFGELSEFEKQKLKIEAFKSLALAIGILVGSLLILTTIPEDKLTNAIVALGVLMGMLFGMFELVTNGTKKMTLKKAQAMNKAVTSLIPLSISILILASALKKISAIPWDQMKYGLVGLIACMSLLMLALMTISKVKIPKKAQGNVGKIFGITIVLLAMSGVLAIMSTIPWKKMATAVGAMTVVLTILVGALAILSKIKISKNAKGNTLKLFGITMVLLTLSGVLAILSTIHWKKMTTAVGAMAVVLAALVGALAILSKIKISKNAEGNILKLVGISVVLLILSGALAILSTIPWVSMISSVSGMALVLIALVGALAILSKIKISKNAEGNVFKLIGISIAMLILSSSLAILATISWKSMISSVSAMALTLIALVGALAILQKIKFSKTAQGNVTKLIGISLALLAMTVVIKQLASMSWNDMLRGIAGMAMTLTALVGALAVIALISKISKSGIGIAVVAASLILLAAALKVIIPSIEQLGTLPIKTIVQGLLAIVAGIAALGIVSALLSSCAPAMIMIAGAITLLGIATLAAGAGIYMFALGLDLLCKTIIQNGSAVVTTLVDIVKAFASLLPFIARKLGEAIIAFSDVIIQGAPKIAEAIITLLLSVIDLLVGVIPPLAEGLFQLIVGLLEVLGQYIGPITDMILSLIIKIIDTITARVPEITESLMNLFVAVLTSFTEAMKQVDMSMLMDGILSLAAISLFLSLLAGLTPLVPLAMVGVLALGVLITELALVLGVIGKITNSGLVESINNSAPLLGSIGTAIGALIGGIVAGFNASAASTLPFLAEQLSSFMVKAQPFIDGLKQLDAGMMTNALTLVGVIAAITGTSILNGINNFLSAIGLSGGGMKTFADDLAYFGKGVKNFNDSTSGVNPKTVGVAAEAGMNLAKMAAAIPKEGGLWQIISGSTKTEDFIKQMSSFGDGISKFGEKVKNVKPDQIKAGAEAGLTLAEMAKSLPKEGGLWQSIVGEGVNPEDFAKQMVGFANGLVSFSTKSNEIDSGGLEAGCEAGRQIAYMLEELPRSGGLWQMITGELDLATLNTNLTNFGESLVSFVDTVNEIGDVNNAVSIVDSLNTSLNNFANSGINSFVSSFTNSSSKVTTSVKSMLDSAIDAINKKSKKFKNTAKDFMKEFTKGIKEYKPTPKDTFKGIVEDSLDALNSKDYYNDFYNAGVSLSEGFASGVDNKSYSVKNKIVSMAKNALQAAKDVLGINSPSKEFINIGEYSGEGLIQGLLNYANTTYDAGSDLGNTAIDGLSNAVAKISSMIENDIDSQPVIRPVLDLSNIQAGAGAINGMFGMSPSVGVMSKVSSISSSMNKNQNGGSDDLISAITDLKHTMENASGDTYNINGITYDSGSELQSAIETIVRATIRERRR